MKIALCISGYIRTFRTTINNLKTNFLSVYPETDIFVHTWTQVDYWNIENVYLHTIDGICRTKKCIIECPKEFDVQKIIHDRNPDPLRNVGHVLSMFYKIKQCNELKKQYEIENNFKYDCVIRFRPDIQLLSNFTIDEDNLDKLNVPKYGDFSGINDQFAYSTSENMDLYCSLFDKINQYLEKDESLFFNPEVLLKYHIEKQNLNINRPEIKYVLLKREDEILDNKKREIEGGFVLPPQ